jgi:hypothetical protein
MNNKYEIEYWDRVDYYSVNSKVKSTEIWEGSKEEIFKKFYDKNNSLRYCNGSYYKFKNKLIEKEYKEWYDSLSENTKFNMYYGNGIVD